MIHSRLIRYSFSFNSPISLLSWVEVNSKEFGYLNSSDVISFGGAWPRRAGVTVLSAAILLQRCNRWCVDGLLKMTWDSCLRNMAVRQKCDGTRGKLNKHLSILISSWKFLICDAELLDVALRWRIRRHFCRIYQELTTGICTGSRPRLFISSLMVSSFTMITMLMIDGGARCHCTAQ